MRNFAIKINDKIYWISRSVATVGFIFCNLNDKWMVLAAKRGEGAADFQGLWNCPCGYLDYDETLTQCCAREIREETGFFISDEALHFDSINDDIAENHQNIIIRFYGTISYGQCKYVSRIPRGGEPNEVEEVKWISVANIDNYQWAFNHDKLIKEIFNKYIK